jgi:hypothetical protein
VLFCAGEVLVEGFRVESRWHSIALGLTCILMRREFSWNGLTRGQLDNSRWAVTSIIVIGVLVKDVNVIV